MRISAVSSPAAPPVPPPPPAVPAAQEAGPSNRTSTPSKSPDSLPRCALRSSLDNRAPPTENRTLGCIRLPPPESHDLDRVRL
jgi:hypothetical protein